MVKEKIYFHDTTLRDGEQTPGVAFSNETRRDIALKLDELGIDIIELGFAASSQEQRDSMRAISELGLRAKTLSLARPLVNDIDAALEAKVDGVILVLGFSDIHLKYKFKKDFKDVLAMLEAGVNYAKRKGLYVQISAEDGTRTPNSRLRKIAILGAKYDVDRICISDTVGIATPEIISDKVKCIIDTCDIPVSVHCHNDFGLATINSISAVKAGARNLAVTMNGLGERTGNASLEQCALALTQLYGYETNIKLNKILEVSNFISDRVKIYPEPMRPIIGKNCFRHESGIHVNAILKNSSCYEPYNPEIIGAESEIILGKTNGLAAIKYFSNKMNVKLTEIECKEVLSEIQKNADSGKKIDSNILEGAVRYAKQRNNNISNFARKF